MMKKSFVFGVLLFSFLSFAQTAGNVGINTANPEQKLHVNGSMRATNLILDQKPYGAIIPKLGATEEYSVLLKSTSANRITTYNIQSASGEDFPAPFGVITFNIATHDSDRDWVNEYDTKINATKYVTVLNYFNFNLPVNNNDTNARRKAPVAQVYTYVKNGTWWVKADYHGFAPPTNMGSGKWEVNLMVFDRAFAITKVHSHNFNGSGTGSASTPLITQ